MRFTKRIQGSQEILLYYIHQYRGFTTNLAYDNACSPRKVVLAMKMVPAPDRTPLRGVAVKLAIKRLSLTRSPLTSSSRHRRRDLRSSDSCSFEPPSTAATLFPAQRILGWPCFRESANLLRKNAIHTASHFARTALLKTFEFRIIGPPKYCCNSSSSSSSTYDLTTNQLASRSQKWAGAEVTLRNAWIKSPILPGLFLNDPPAVGSSRQVTLLEDSAVV